MSVYEFLSEHPEYEKILKKIYEYEKENLDRFRQWKEQYGTDIGWEWHEVGVHPVRLTKLVGAGILKIVYKSSSHTEYRLADFDEVKQYFEGKDIAEKITTTVEKKKIDPDDLFRYIVGYDDLKKVFRMALKSEKPIHILLIGPPATAKTLFLEDIYNAYDDAEFVIGSTASSAGLFKILEKKRPKILLIDEIDKILNSEDLSVLLSVMESGVLRRVKGDRVTDLIHLNTKVFAAGNSDKYLPKELRDRFLVFYLKEYTKDQFIEVCKNYLTNFEGVSPEIAEYIAEKVWEIDRSVRTARSIARMCGNDKKNVDFLLDVLKRYRR